MTDTTRPAGVADVLSDKLVAGPCKLCRGQYQAPARARGFYPRSGVMTQEMPLVRFVLEPAVFVQARMTSQRLPGKVMLEVAGRPVLAYLLERLAHCQRTSMVVVLTSRDPSDDAVADFCQRQGLECFRGDLHNVARRFADALDHYGVEGFVRISGDSPLLDQALVDQCLSLIHI